MMSKSLYRLGHLAARRPWVVIGSWLVLAVVVVGASGAFGHRLKDSMQVPGLDSQQASELMAAAGASDAGLTAQVVVTPLDDDATFFDSAEAGLRSPLLRRATPRRCPTSSGRREVVSPDGRVALIRLQYPLVDELSAQDLSNLKAFGAEAEAGSPLRLEMGGDLYFAFEQPQPAVGELIGLLVAALILFVAFGSLIATALPLGTAVLGLAVGVSSMSLIANVIDIPSWAPVLGAMVGLGVGIDYALFIVTRHRDYLARGLPVAESVGSALATAGKPVVVAGRHRRRGDPRAGRGRRPVHDRRWHRDLGRRPRHGGRLGHAAACVPGPGRARTSTGAGTVPRAAVSTAPSARAGHDGSGT